MGTRIPGYELGTYSWYQDDTGAEMPVISAGDIDDIQSAADRRKPAPIHFGYDLIETISGRVISWVVGLEMVMTTRPGRGVELTTDVMRMMRAITRPTVVPVLVMPPNHFERLGRSVRLTSGWWRDLVYNARAPDNSGDLIVGTDKASVVNALPDVNPLLARTRDLPTPNPNSKSPFPTVATQRSHLNR